MTPTQAQQRALSKAMRGTPCKGTHRTSVLGDGTCEHCAPLYELRYPQGWSYYPGDVCEHGTYTGGSGIDYMCHPCEMGYSIEELKEHA